MKKRLISLLLAFSMMLTFLPAGAVSAFAEGTADDTTKGELLQNGDNIEKAGTYQLYGNYNQGIKINTEGPVVINVTGNVTVDVPDNVNNFYFITIEKADRVTINDDAQYPVTVNGGSAILNKGGNLTVKGGKYVCTARNYRDAVTCFSLSHGENQIGGVTIQTSYQAISFGFDGVKAVIESSNIEEKDGIDGFGAIVCRSKIDGKMELNKVEVDAEDGSALRAESGTITINGGKYKSNQGTAIATSYNLDDDLDLTINGGTYQNGNYNWPVANFGCYVGRTGRDCNIHIHGGTFVGGQLLNFYGSGAKTLTIDENTILQSTEGTADAVIVGDGQLIFKSGTIEVPDGSEYAALRTYDTGEAIVDGGTFKGAKYDIREQYNYDRMPPCRVQLKNANFDDTVCNVYLDRNRQIDVAQNYTGQVTIECADPSDGRQLTKDTETNYQKDLNLTSANAGYLVGYKKTTDGKGEYRCLSKKVGVTVSDLKSEIKAEDSAEFTVTLTYKDSTGTGILTFGDKNGEIEYKDKNGEYKPMPDDGLPIINLASDNNDYAFRITPKKAGDQKLTAAVVRDAVEVGKDSETYHVAGRVHTTVTIEGLKDAVIKEGESKDFTVKVDPNDDANLGEAFIDFGDKNSEIEYKDEESGEYKPMPEGGLPIDLS